MKEIKLSKSDLVALIDNDMLDKVSQYKWLASKRGGNIYAVANTWNPATKTKKLISLHRLIMDAPKGIGIDHINHNTLDNQRHNLRYATQQQQTWNRSTPAYNKSGFKGVHKNGNRWRALIYKDNHCYHLGYFDTPEEAAAAYDKKAIELFREFACLNNA